MPAAPVGFDRKGGNERYSWHRAALPPLPIEHDLNWSRQLQRDRDELNCTARAEGDKTIGALRIGFWLGLFWCAATAIPSAAARGP